MYTFYSVEFVYTLILMHIISLLLYNIVSVYVMCFCCRLIAEAVEDISSGLI